MPEVTLRIQNEGDITLPGDIANSSLSLSEIGALVCFSAMQAGVVELRPDRFEPEEAQAALKGLKDKGVLSASFEAGTLKISLDLTSIMPAEPEANEP